MNRGEELPESALEKLLADGAEMLREAGETPEKLGKYLLVRELGRGGMGVVWEAEDTELGRRVAIKLLADRLTSDSDARRRFVFEARAAARLSHPNIAAVYEADERMLVMQLVEGIPLHLAPRDDLRRTVSWIRDAARAVHHAHERGIVHRDLKPANLMLEGERVLVTDFGLAKAAPGVSSGEEVAVSQSGSLLGTPAYMAPEQADGRSRDVDPRTDVYGLGATLYDLLAGRPPFAVRDVVKLLRQIVEDEPPTPRTTRPEIPRDLCTVVLRCLAKEKERRYPTARALADDLDRWLQGEAVEARPPSVRYRIAKFVRRRRAVVTVGAVGAVAIAVVLLLARRDAAIAGESLQLSDRVHTTLADVPMLKRNGEVEHLRELLDARIEECQAFLDKREVAHVHYLLGRLLSACVREQEALASLDRALDLDSQLSEAYLERGCLRAAAFFRWLVEHDPGQDPRDAGLPDTQRDLRIRALDDLQRVERDPGSLPAVEVLFAKAELARLMGDRGQARLTLERILKLDKVHERARLAMSQLELAEGDPDRAWHLAMSALDLYRGFGPAYVAQEDAEVTGDDLPQEAASAVAAVQRAILQHQRQALEAAVLADPENARAAVELGRYLRRDGQPAEDRRRGLEELRRALTLAPDPQLRVEIEAEIQAASGNTPR